VQLTGNKCSMVVDSGTSVITGPSSIINPLMDRINATLDCSNVDSLPPLAFVIAGRTFTLTADQYVIRINTPGQQPPVQCQTGVMAMDMDGLWILGDTFMRSYFSIFDRDQNRVGFATANPNPPAAAATDDA
jgi:cathepsin D